MRKAPHKFVLLLAEGGTDVTALYRPLKALFKEVDPDLELWPLIPPKNGRCHDITVEPMESPERMNGLISSVFIHDFLEQNYLLPTDIARVIQLVDLDGAFIPNANVLQGEDKVSYGDYAIYAPSVDGIRRRNRTKRANLEYLSKLKRLPVYPRTGRSGIREKSYSVYYFSSNMDHFFHGNANMTDDEKTRAARAFSDMCEADPERFIDIFTRQDEETSGLTYAESWDYIKEGLNSLQPHSNLGVLVNELLREKRKNARG